MITGAQIRAARAFLDWTREELAKKSGLTTDGIKRIESNPDQRPHQKTLEILVEVFTDNGIDFSPNGVRLTDETVRILEGENAYMRMLDDVLQTTKKGGEVLFFCSDDRATRPNEIDMEQMIRNNGVHFRCLVEEGNDFTRWPRNEYRQIPSEYFNHDLQVIYGNKVAQVIAGGKKIMIVTNTSFATTARNIFNMLWPQMRPLPKKSKKDE